MFLSSIGTMPTGAWGSDDLQMFWDYVRWFLAENQMWVMICIAFFMTVGVTAIILNLFIRKKEDEDDDEYDLI